MQFRSFSLCLIAVAAVFANTADAQVFSGDTASGNFTVTASGCSTGGFDYCALTETGPSSHWQQWTYDYGTLSVPRNLSPGTYTYTITGYVWVPDWGQYWEGNLAQTSITVTGGPPPAIDPVSTQSQYEYSVQRGDIDANGRQDLFIQRTSGGASGNGVIYNVILLGRADGGFNSAVPTSAQISVAAGWPLVSPELNLIDIDLDGFVDVVLKGLSGLISGALDQIVMSSGQPNALAPKGVVNMNANFNKFASEVWEFNQNPNYFNENVPWVQEPVYDVYLFCDWYYIPEYGGWDYYCWYEYVFVGWYSYPNYGVFHPSALALFDNFPVENGQKMPTINPGNAMAKAIHNIFQGVFGTAPFRGILNTGCNQDTGGAFRYDGDITVPCIDIDFFGQVFLRTLLTHTPVQSCRLLTPGEMSMSSGEGLVIRGVFLVRVCRAAYKLFGLFPLASQVMSPNGNIYIGPGQQVVAWREDYSSALPPLASELVHELVHVYQNRTRGCNVVCMYWRAALAMLDYQYAPLDPNKTYFDYNIEEQAQMVQDRYLLRRGYPHKALYDGDNSSVSLPQLEGLIPF